MEPSFGARLRQLRLDSGLSLRQLASRLHYDPGYLSKIENGLKRPSMDLAEACDHVLDTGGALAGMHNRAIHTGPVRAAGPDGLTAAVVRSLPGSTGPTSADGSEPDVELALPGGRTFDGARLHVQMRDASWADDRRSVLAGRDVRLLDHAGGVGGPPALLVTTRPGTDRVGYLALDRRGARTQSLSGSVSIPTAFELDDLTCGLIWALANIDGALLDDDAPLTEATRVASAESDEALPRELLGELSATSAGWLGSSTCARFILDATQSYTSRPTFWTREQRGEEAAAWLWHRHKLDYLRHTVRRFGATPEAPVARGFCVPPDAVRSSFPAERLLLLLAAALMESLGIRTYIATDPDLATVEGFVLAEERVVVANWVRTGGHWYVDETTSRPVLAGMREVTGHAATYSVSTDRSPGRRLAAMADYLSLDWSWVTRRARDLSAHPISDLARPRSRLLSTEGVDLAISYLSTMTAQAG